MTELEFRNKVTWFSFALSLLVIWVHSYNAELFLGYQAATGMVYVLEHRIGDWLGQIAVPGFFMISPRPGCSAWQDRILALASR